MPALFIASADRVAVSSSAAGGGFDIVDAMSGLVRVVGLARMTSLDRGRVETSILRNQALAACSKVFEVAATTRCAAADAQ